MSRPRQVKTYNENKEILKQKDKLFDRWRRGLDSLDKNTDRISDYTVPLQSDRVAGGIKAEEHQFPWVVYFHAIAKRKNGIITNFCGGSLVHPR